MVSMYVCMVSMYVCMVSMYVHVYGVYVCLACDVMRCGVVWCGVVCVHAFYLHGGRMKETHFQIKYFPTGFSSEVKPTLMGE